MATMKVKHSGNPSPYIIINEWDFDPVTMEKYDGPDNEPNPHAESVQAVAGDMSVDGIAEAIVNLQMAGNADDFTAAGKPTVEALERELGIDITAGQRDEAWRRIQEDAK